MSERRFVDSELRFGFRFGKNPAAGVGLLAAATRLKPNAFHFRRQVIILQRAGGGSAERQFEELWLTWFQMNDKITVYSSSQVCVWM